MSVGSAQTSLEQITDAAVLDIAKKVACVDLEKTPAICVDERGGNSLVTTTKGDYELTIVLYTTRNVLRAIAENMRRGRQADENDIAVCAGEFFNILCGHVVSTLNRSLHASARFGIPQLIGGRYECVGEYDPDMCAELGYRCPHGPVLVRIMFWHDCKEHKKT